MGSVRGPLSNDKSGAPPFLSTFLENAQEDDMGNLRPGDVIALDDLTVMYGEVISIVYDPLKGEDESSTIPRVRVRARLREPTDVGAPKLPFGHVLVKGVEAKDGKGLGASSWCPVEAARSKASEARKGTSLRSGVVAEFFIYDADSRDEDDLRDGAVFTSLETYDVNVLESPSFSSIWDYHQSRVDDVEGVLFHDDAVPGDLVASLNQNITRFARNQAQPDYHPNSKGIVLDIVHPSLFSYVAGVSNVERGVKESKRLIDPESQSSDPVETPPPRTDRWGREFSESKFAWLPAVVDVSADGECEFKSVCVAPAISPSCAVTASLCRL